MMPDGKEVSEEVVMPGDDRKAHWDAVYAGKVQDQVSWYQAWPATSLELIARTGKGPGGSVIDVGGGTSRLVDALLDERFEDLAVLDISAEALARSQERLGARATGVTWIVSDVCRWKPARTFEVWHDRAVFHFLVSPEDRKAYRKAMAAALATGGQAVIGTFALDGPERCSGLPVARYEPETLAAELGAGFRIVESRYEDHWTPSGGLQPFQFSRFVKVQRVKRAASAALDAAELEVTG
jgi:hypothetical protein